MFPSTTVPVYSSRMHVYSTLITMWTVTFVLFVTCNHIIFITLPQSDKQTKCSFRLPFCTLFRLNWAKQVQGTLRWVNNEICPWVGSNQQPNFTTNLWEGENRWKNICIFHTDPKFRKQGILKVNDLFEYQSILFMYDYISGKLPRSFAGTFPLNQDMQQTHTTRQSDLLYIPRYSSRYAQKLPEFHLPKIWNNWVRSLPQNSSRNIIKKFTKSKLLRSYPEHVKCENIHCIECHRRQWSDVCVTSIYIYVYKSCPVPDTRFLF